MDDYGGFDPKALLETLVEHDVDFVLIGGMAATLYGSPHITTDADITPASTPNNLDHLAQALVALDARIRVEGVLTEDAVRLDLGDLEVSVASLDDIIRSKEAADREKDRLTLPTLRRLRDRLDREATS